MKHSYIFKEIISDIENMPIEELKADLLKHSGGAIGRCFEQQFLQIPTFDYPALEEIDEWIAEIERMRVYDKHDRQANSFRLRGLKKIRKELYSGDRRY